MAIIENQAESLTPGTMGNLRNGLDQEQKPEMELEQELEQEEELELEQGFRRVVEEGEPVNPGPFGMYTETSV